MVHQPKSDTIITGTTAPIADRPLPAKEEIENFHLHLKHVGTLDCVALAQLYCKHPEILQEALAALETYIHNPSIYEKFLAPDFHPRSMAPAFISAQHSQQMIDHGLVEPVEYADCKGSVVIFKVLELFKERFRLIQHPKEHNEKLPPAPKVTFNSTETRRQSVHLGTHAADRDVASYYHHFLLAVLVRNFFCARLPMADGKTQLVRLRLGPTGQSHMVYVAVAVMNAILDFDRRSTYTDSHIDNILFIGSYKDVYHDLVQVIQRCESINIQLNDPTPDLISLVKTNVEWCGMVLDLSNKSVCMTKKSMDKLALSWSGREGWTWQGFAAHIGLLWWSMQILKIPACRFFEVLRFVSDTSRAMQAAGDRHWNRPAVIYPSVWRDLVIWTDIAMKNEPVYVVPHKEPDVRFLVDASSFGWGFVAHDIVTNKTYQYGSRWSPSFISKHSDRLGKSTFTEPWAVIFTKNRLTKLIKRPNISFYGGCDNSPTVWVFNKGFSSRSYSMNHAALTDHLLFADRHQCLLRHVKGSDNVLADAKSRGLSILDNSTTFGDDVIIDSLRRLLGDLPVDQLATPNPTGVGKGEADVLPNPC